MHWWSCDDPYDTGVWRELNHDNWVWLTHEYSGDFCIDVTGGGTGYFDGWVSWDGYS